MPELYISYDPVADTLYIRLKSDEVVASWGFPNVLLVDDHFKSQHWVYYTRGSDDGSVLIYTLDLSQ